MSDGSSVKQKLLFKKKNELNPSSRSHWLAGRNSGFRGYARGKT